jgi:NAD(P)-dependent dehydrogenase (short-subunit alcohol dehydrogenase family)
MEQYFMGRTALVTGAAWGVGAACALLYAAHGAKVVVSGTCSEDAANIVGRIKEKKGIATYIEADMSSSEGCEQLIERTIRTYGSIDFACNNSALFSEIRRPAYQDIEGLDKELDIDLGSLYYCMKHEVGAMQKQGAGVIVNMSCLPGIIGLTAWRPPIYASYVRTGSERYEPRQYRGKGVRINTILPDLVMAALLEKANSFEDAGSSIMPHSDRLSKIEQVAHLVLWLSL